MSKIALGQTLYLLKKANSMGLRISLSNEELIIKIQQKNTIDKLFLEEIKQNKSLLVEYFKNNDIQPRLPSTTKVLMDRFKSRSKSFHKVPIVYHWWLDGESDQEVKKKLYLLVAYRIKGNFDVTSFKKAVKFVINRHESLRATFHRTGKKRYWMKIAETDDPFFDLDYLDRSDVSSNDSDLINRLLCFSGHEFDLENGPLFLIRLIRCSNNEFLVSVKMHHVIYDAWSVEILSRDLFLSYRAFAENKAPELAPLQFQYRNYMAFINHNVRKYSKRDRQYWKSLYASCSPGILIPGQKRREEKLPVVSCLQEIFRMPEEVTERLVFLARKYSQSLFLVIQASLKLYLYKNTGQNDIAVATTVFGREQDEGFQDQIGLYSKMNILRTVLAESDSFEDALKKVHRSNEDMHTYVACPLLSVLHSVLRKRKQADDALWKMAIYYTDLNGFINKSYLETQSFSDDLSITPVSPQSNEISSTIDLHLDFLKHKDHIDLKIVYAMDLFDAETIGNLANGFFAYIKNIVDVKHSLFR